ncbi:hypothetical protein [Rhodococcus sp. BE178]|uniref:hypothetical protein n=1 Tax=Rhodococcus sp. BE178 TaxID=2817737 RepID=UPI003D2191C1
MNSVKELADALVADGRYFMPRDNGDTPLSAYHAGEYQIAVVMAFEEAAEKSLPMPADYQQAALDLIVNRPGADEIDAEALEVAIDELRSATT